MGKPTTPRPQGAPASPKSSTLPPPPPPLRAESPRQETTAACRSSSSSGVPAEAAKAAARVAAMAEAASPSKQTQARLQPAHPEWRSPQSPQTRTLAGLQQQQELEAKRLQEQLEKLQQKQEQQEQQEQKQRVQTVQQQRLLQSRPRWPRGSARRQRRGLGDAQAGLSPGGQGATSSDNSPGKDSTSTIPTRENSGEFIIESNLDSADVESRFRARGGTETQSLLPNTTRGRPLTCQAFPRESSPGAFRISNSEDPDHEFFEDRDNEADSNDPGEARLLAMQLGSEEGTSMLESDDFCSKKFAFTSVAVFVASFVICSLVALLVIHGAGYADTGLLHRAARRAAPPIAPAPPTSLQRHQVATVEEGVDEPDLVLQPAFCRGLPRGPWPPECANFQPGTKTEAGSAELDFEPVDGGVNRLCRGVTETDNSDGYYKVVSVKTLQECKVTCAISPSCLGIEFMENPTHPRCELWTRAVMTSAPGSEGFTCLRFNPLGFEPVVEEAKLTRALVAKDSGADAAVTSAVVHHGATSLYACKALCVSALMCRGIEYEHEASVCRVFSKALGPGRSDPRPSGVLRLSRALPGFDPLGEVGHCVGDSLSAETHLVQTLEDCKAQCFMTPQCTGLKHFSGNCVLWKGKIQYLKPITGVSCFRFKRPEPAHSLFCVSLARALSGLSGDIELLRMQRERRSGIFGCEEWAAWSHKIESLGDGQYTTALRRSSPNAPIAQEIWRSIVADGRFRSHGWVVKVEAEAVFFPGRLRLVLQGNQYDSRVIVTRGILLTSCVDMTDHRGGRLRQPMEVLSSRALEVWAIGHQQCGAAVSGAKGEDADLQHCLHEVLGVPELHVPELLAENGCFRDDHGTLENPDWMDCSSNHSAFYPLMTEKIQKTCIGMVEAITPNMFGFGKLPSL